MTNFKKIGFLLIAAGLATTFNFPVRGNAQLKKIPLAKGCTPIAQLVSMQSPNQSRSRIICEEDQLKVNADALIKVVCLSDNSAHEINGQAVSVNSVCQKSAESVICVRNAQGQCYRGRSPVLVNRPSLISPALPITSNLRPRFQWQAVPGATAYTIQLAGNGGIFWQLTTSETNIEYPQDQPPLIIGHAYNILVFAYQGNQPIANSLSSINILTPEQITANFPPIQSSPTETGADIANPPAVTTAPAVKPQL